tara:strand:+ start:36773 stop:37216 length:444 start_codon:yes stop_codon:yes gene_type:complete
MKSEEIKTQINELEKQKVKLCKNATAGIVEKMAELKRELSEAAILESIEMTGQYIRLSEIVGEMARKVIVINFAFGRDEEFQITPHVNWLEWEGAPRDFNGFKNHYKYSHEKNGEVDFEAIKELSEEIDEKYQAALAKLKNMGAINE